MTTEFPTPKGFAAVTVDSPEGAFLADLCDKVSQGLAAMMDIACRAGINPEGVAHLMASCFGQTVGRIAAGETFDPEIRDADRPKLIGPHSQAEFADALCTAVRANIDLAFAQARAWYSPENKQRREFISAPVMGSA
ncbi:hypothetical protein [Enterovirga aerilata]|uniref:Uncharacterized protein n=1 Tax=Enterovirga aerilata TaxID=2730920 RepID=A0A849IE89_9HYPH|nr:hypothetical protein [Enterovirga sp. DB1703]NNM74769.1 hypothetical protein [Enterovirga sp. DB1703]